MDDAAGRDDVLAALEATDQEVLARLMLGWEKDCVENALLFTPALALARGKPPVLTIKIQELPPSGPRDRPLPFPT